MVSEKKIRWDSYIFFCIQAVDPWYPQVYGSKETGIEENPQMLWKHRGQYSTMDAWFIFLITLHNSAKDMLPFNKSHIFTLSLNTITFALHFGHHLLLGRQIFTKLKAEKHLADRSHSDLSTTDDNTGLTKRFSISPEPH
jgi:DNA replication protein DnaD